MERLLPETGVYIDTSFALGSMVSNGDGYYKTADDLKLLSGEQFVRLIRAFGMEKVLFGTDSPWGAQDDEIQKFKAFPLSDAEQNSILGQNASHLLRL